MVHSPAPGWVWHRYRPTDRRKTQQLLRSLLQNIVRSNLKAHKFNAPTGKCNSFRTRLWRQLLGIPILGRCLPRPDSRQTCHRDAPLEASLVLMSSDLKQCRPLSWALSFRSGRPEKQGNPITDYCDLQEPTESAFFTSACLRQRIRASWPRHQGRLWNVSNQRFPIPAAEGVIAATVSLVALDKGSPRCWRLAPRRMWDKWLRASGTAWSTPGAR